VVQAVAQINITKYREHLSLPYLHELSLTNLRHIDQLLSKLLSSPIVSSGSVLAIVIIFLIIAHKVRRQNKLQKRSEIVANLHANMRKPEDVLLLAQGGVNHL